MKKEVIAGIIALAAIPKTALANGVSRSVILGRGSLSAVMFGFVMTLVIEGFIVAKIMVDEVTAKDWLKGAVPSLITYPLLILILFSP